ncbi:MAG TPA: DUF2156 domain-containing protein, partial [Schlesneria sp.]
MPIPPSHLRFTERARVLGKVSKSEKKAGVMSGSVLKAKTTRSDQSIAVVDSSEMSVPALESPETNASDSHAVLRIDDSDPQLTTPHESQRTRPSHQHVIKPNDISSRILNIEHGPASSLFRTFSRIDQPATRTLVDDDTAAYRDQLIFQHGEYFDSYLATEPGRLEFWSSTREGLISCTRRGRYLLVGGGLIASDQHKPTLLKEFTEFLARKKLVASFHNIGDHELSLFREYGYQVTKWGEEPVLDLGQITWQGKPFEWVRRQTNYCLRQGLVAFEVVPADLTEAQWAETLAELQEVAAESISAKPQKEMTFFEGTIGTHEIGRRRVFVVRSEHGFGRIEGFVVCNPMRDGAMWATEMYRRRIDAVKGTMAYLFRYAIDQFQSEGATRVGMCLDPSLRCSEKLPGDSPIIRFGMTWGEAGMALVFDLAGIRHFKSRFRPRYENRYCCVYPKASFCSVFAFGL